MTKPKAYYQAYLVLNCLSKQEYSLIPENLLNEIKSNMEVDESIKVDSSISLEKQKLDDKTYDILNKVIRAIEKAYGKDAIDNPSKYANTKEETFSAEDDISGFIIEDDIIVDEPKDDKTNINANNSKENRIKDRYTYKDNSSELRDLRNENLRLKTIIEALENENQKIDKAKDLMIDYKEMLSKKNEKIEELIKENNKLKEDNSILISEIEKVPKIIKRIFMKDTVKLLK